MLDHRRFQLGQMETLEDKKKKNTLRQKDRFKFNLKKRKR